MPQNNTDITSSPEFKEFCKENNLEVYNIESINVFLFQVYKQIEEGNKAHNLLVDAVYEPKIDTLKECKDLEARIQKLEERLMEVGMKVKEPDIREIREDGFLQVTYGGSLADKWKDTRSMTTEEVMANAVKC